jgi:P4 family phage/plasmid primase-like protien
MSQDLIKKISSNLPPELKTLNTFCLWMEKPDAKDHAKIGKAPFDWTFSKRGNDDPDLHLPLSTAIQKLNKYPDKGLAIYQPELGNRISINGKDYYLHILDLDGFVYDNQILGLGADIAEMTGNSYMEVSPSGVGAKIFLLSDMPAFGKKKFPLPPNEFFDEHPDIVKYGPSHAVEAFSGKFWNTVTGDVWSKKYANLQVVNAQDLQAIFDLLEALAPQEVANSKPTMQMQVSAVEEGNYSRLTHTSLVQVLSKIDNQDEQVWSDVANALARAYGQAGKDYFVQYSEGVYNGLPYPGFDEMVAAERFQRALDELHKHPTGYGIKHLCTLAGIGFSGLAFESGGELPASISEQEDRILGDKQNGELFARYYRGQFLYVWQLDQWFRWNGVIWEECTGGEVEAAAKQVSTVIANKALEALKSGDESGNSRRLFTHAFKAQNNQQIKSMIALSRSEPDMSEKSVDRLNHDTHLLGVKNGVVDLKTGMLVQPDPIMLMTKQCNANYLTDTQCPQWLKFLNEVFQGKQELINSIQRLLGYTFTGSVTEEIMVICYGFGANGKSVMSNVIQHVAGGYGKTGSPSLLKSRRDDDSSPRSDIAGLAGYRYISLNEMQSGDRLDEQVVKLLAGREAISARALYKDHMTYKPSGKVWLKTNHKPIVKEDDDGIWRRLVVIPFGRKFAEAERNPNLEEQLIQEADGILAWIIQGAVQWHQNGLSICPTIKQESAEYRTESDLLGHFLEERVEFDDAARAIETDVYFFYQNWCRASGTNPLSKIRLTQKLKERGVRQLASNGKRYYLGIKLVEFKESSGIFEPVQVVHI